MALAGSSPLLHDDQEDAEFFDQLENDLQFSVSENDAPKSAHINLSDPLKFEVPSGSIHGDIADSYGREQTDFNDVFAKLSMEDGRSLDVASEAAMEVSMRETESNVMESSSRTVPNEKFESGVCGNSNNLQSQERHLVDGPTVIPSLSIDSCIVSPSVAASAASVLSPSEGLLSSFGEFDSSVVYRTPSESAMVESAALTHGGVHPSFEKNKLLREGSFTFAVSEPDRSSSENACTFNWGSLATTDSGLSSSKSVTVDTSQYNLPETNVQLQTGYKQLEWSCFSEADTIDGEGTFGSFSDFLSELTGNTKESELVSDTEQKADIPFYSFLNYEQQSLLPSREERRRWDILDDPAIEKADQCLEGTQLESKLHLEECVHRPTAFVDSGHKEAKEQVQKFGYGVTGQYSEFESDWHQPWGQHISANTTNVLQCQPVSSGQPWETMYPGWYYDYATDTWLQVEDQDAIGVSLGTSTSAVIDDRFSGKDEKNFLSHSREGVPPELHGEVGVGQDNLCHSDAIYSTSLSLVSAEQKVGSQSSQPEVEAVKTCAQNSELSWQQVANTDDDIQQKVSWEQQYPGWYFDHQSQDWRQINDNFQVQLQDASSSYRMETGSHWDRLHESIGVSEDQHQGGSLLGYGQGHGKGQEVSPVLHNSSYNIIGQNTSQKHSNVTNLETRAGDLSYSAIDSHQCQEHNPSQQLVGNMNQILERDPVPQPVISANPVPVTWPGIQGLENTHSNGLMDFAQIADNRDYYGSQQSSLYFESYHCAFTTLAPRTTAEGLGSTAGRPPHALVAFGFGGKILVMKSREPIIFHSTVGEKMQTVTSGQTWTSGPLVLYNLCQMVVESVNRRGRGGGTSYFTTLNRQGVTGPLVGGNISTKDLLRWIDERVTNCEVEEPECSNPAVLRVLWCLLKTACQHYGKLRTMIGSTGINSQGEDGADIAVGKLLSSVRSQGSWNKKSVACPKPLRSVPTEVNLQATANEMKNLLVAGKRKDALQLAQRGQLWGLALVLSWQLGEKVYADTVTLMARQQFVPGSPLWTLCLLLAGQGVEVFSVASPPSPSLGSYPTVGAPYSGKDAFGIMLDDWLENLAIIAANHTKGDEEVIMQLGDTLWKTRGEVAGAHICYLVAEASFESFSGNARLCLIGADHFKYPRTFGTPESIQRTELYEYAKVLGNPQFMLLPFQPYKLVYAHMLAEAGKITEAIRYCQAVSKTLKAAGRAPEIESCRHSAMVLEDQLRMHSQGGYGLNLEPRKLMGKLINKIDSTIHKIIGGPPYPVVHSSGLGTASDFSIGGYNIGNSSTRVSPTPLVPSASMEPIRNLLNGDNHAAVPPRSISEPDLSKNPKQTHQEKQSSASSDLPSPVSNNLEISAGGYLGRFGSQLIAKAVGLLRHNKKEAKLGEKNKFYYDAKLKRWVEEGAEPTPGEVALPPPPTTAKFLASPDTSPLEHESRGATEGQALTSSSGKSGFSSGIPPIPANVNQFSARGRLQGVRSRYVDTFNKAGASSLPPKPTQSLSAPAGLGLSTTPANFFVPTSLANDELCQLIDERQIHRGCAELDSNSNVFFSNGHMETENELLVPKNLYPSFLAMPTRRSSADNLAKNASNGFANGNSLISDNLRGVMENGKMGNGTISRAVSWSGHSSFQQAEEASTAMGSRAIHQSVPSNREQLEQIHFSAVSTPASFSASFPSPPHIDLPQLYAGMDNSLASGTMEGSTHMQSSNGMSGGIYGEMQEVEL